MANHLPAPVNTIPCQRETPNTNATSKHVVTVTLKPHGVSFSKRSAMKPNAIAAMVKLKPSCVLFCIGAIIRNLFVPSQPTRYEKPSNRIWKKPRASKAILS
jgi:hypothetical protein